MGIRQVSAVLLTLMFLSTALFAQSASTSTLTAMLPIRQALWSPMRSFN